MPYEFSKILSPIGISKVDGDFVVCHFVLFKLRHPLPFICAIGIRPYIARELVELPLVKQPRKRRLILAQHVGNHVRVPLGQFSGAVVEEGKSLLLFRGQVSAPDGY